MYLRVSQRPRWPCVLLVPLHSASSCSPSCGVSFLLSFALWGGVGGAEAPRLPPAMLTLAPVWTGCLWAQGQHEGKGDDFLVKGGRAVCTTGPLRGSLPAAWAPPPAGCLSRPSPAVLGWASPFPMRICLLFFHFSLVSASDLVLTRILQIRKPETGTSLGRKGSKDTEE